MPQTTSIPRLVVVLNAFELAGSWHRWVGHIITGLTGTQLWVTPGMWPAFFFCVASMGTCDGIH